MASLVRLSAPLVFALLSGFATNAGAAEVEERIRLRLDAMITTSHTELAGARVRALGAVREVFAARAFAPAWTGRSAARLDTLRALLGEAPGWGLSPCAYHLEQIDAARTSDLSAIGARVDLEILATDAALLLGVHLASGRVSPETFDPEWFATKREMDAVAWLRDALDTGTLGRSVRALEPNHAAYRRLVAAHESLLRLRGEDWPAAPYPGRTVRAGDDSSATGPLRARLAALGDLPAAAAADSAALDAAIRRFQERHGLASDGAAGPRTYARLALTPDEIRHTLALNLERWRWLPEDLGERHVRVNIAGYRLELVDGSRIDAVKRVIVGKAYRRTPVFSATMRYVVLCPSWEVPPTILQNDVVPALRKDPAAARARGMQVLAGWGADEQRIDMETIDWSSIRPGRFPYRVRQRPGPDNPLGVVKLMFPNRFSVYIHDTNNRELLARDDRSMSSGCIRVEDPLEVTRWALNDDARWPLATLAALATTGEERSVPLPAPLPVHLQYWTAWVEPDGTMHLRPDVYGRDRQLSEALETTTVCH